MPCDVRLVTSREDGNKVSDGSTEDTHRGGELGIASGVLRYCSITRCKASVLSSPFEPVLLVISLFTVLTPISALQLLWGKATDERR